MTNLFFFLASDLSPHLNEKLAQLFIKSENARGVFLYEYIAQFKHCIDNNRIIVTKNKKLIILCEQMNHPYAFIFNGSGKDEEIINEIKRFIRLFKLQSLAA